jgi:hypothetical protein
LYPEPDILAHATFAKLTNHRIVIYVLTFVHDFEITFIKLQNVAAR